MTRIEDMKGLTIVEVVGKEKDDEITFRTKEGRTFRFYHSQSCCESVYLEEIIGDLEDLIGRPLVLAEDVSSEAPTTSETEDGDQEWTFYRLGTDRGVVTLRFYGTSNGYYSTSVDIEET